MKELLRPIMEQRYLTPRNAEAPVEPICECGCPFEAHISAMHVMIPCLTCRPCTKWRPVAA